MKRIGFRISAQLREKYRQAVEKEGYGDKGRSKWTREAIRILVDADPKLMRVGVGDALDGPHDLHETISCDDNFQEILRDSILLLRRQSPLLEGPQSKLIRSAIRYRLSTPARAVSAGDKRGLSRSK